MRERTWFDHNFILSFSIHHDKEINVDILPFHQEATKQLCYALKENFKSICAVAYVNNNHFVFIDVDLTKKTVTVDDSLGQGTSGTKSYDQHIKFLLDRYSLSGNDFRRMTITTIPQNDYNSCGPIACRNLWAKLDPNNAPKLGEDTLHGLRKKIVQKALLLMREHDDDITTTLSSEKKRETCWIHVGPNPTKNFRQCGR